MIKISIIIPVYNCEKYLEECLDSVLRQTLKEYEIICVDDGSTDCTIDILKKYAEQDSRIKVLHQKNQGAGVARNLGLKHAEGEYIAFLDSDDYYLDTDALMCMYEICKKNDVDVCGSSLRLLRNGVIVEDNGFDDVKKDAKHKTVLYYKDYQFDYGYCGFIYKKKVILDNNIDFPTYRRFQDPPFLVRAMTYANKFCFVEKALYCYRTPNVVARFNQINVVDLIKGIIDNLEFAMANELDILFERTSIRLNIEYSNIICHNINDKDTKILELLLKANTLINKKNSDANGIINPLKKILSSVGEIEEYHRKILDKKLEQCEKIYIYGAGKATTDFLYYLEKVNVLNKVIAIIVSNKCENPDSIKAIPVISVDAYQHLLGNLILITVTSIYQKEIVDKLKNMGIDDYEIVNIGMLCL